MAFKYFYCIIDNTNTDNKSLVNQLCVIYNLNIKSSHSFHVHVESTLRYCLRFCTVRCVSPNEVKAYELHNRLWFASKHSTTVFTTQPLQFL